jgi:hypothetical protein
MSENPFAAVLSEQLAEREAAQESLRILQEFCRGVELSTANQVSCMLERGHSVNYGQEWRPTLRSVYGGFPQLLFRAYVPAGGWPVHLDLHDGALTRVDGPDELTAALQAFLREPDVVEQIRYVMSYLSPPEPVRNR